VGATQQANNLSVVVLRDPDESHQTRTRVEVTRNLVGNAAEWHEVWAEGTSLFERLLTLTYLGDFVSLYLAYLNRVDPYTIDYIDLLKAELKKQQVANRRGRGFRALSKWRAQAWQQRIMHVEDCCFRRRTPTR
jgi:hypothetical protein